MSKRDLGNDLREQAQAVSTIPAVQLTPRGASVRVVPSLRGARFETKTERPSMTLDRRDPPEADDRCAGGSITTRVALTVGQSLIGTLELAEMNPCRFYDVGHNSLLDETINLQLTTAKLGGSIRSHVNDVAMMMSELTCGRTLRLTQLILSEEVVSNDNQRDVSTDNQGDVSMDDGDMCSDTSSSDSDVLPGFFPIYCDLRGTMTDRKVYQAYKGQLKLSVYINYGLLTVHVMQARMLQSQTPGLCDAYIKLCLDPDTTNRTCCMTEVVHDSNNPMFDEKFSFAIELVVDHLHDWFVFSELLEEDISKRLLISVWNRGAELCEDEFLGSMSFGIQHIQQHGQIVAGWYYLLMGDIGNRKHLRVQEKKRGSIPSVNTDIKWMEPHTFVLKRKRGFGFSLCGSCPVSVSKVEPG
ncbi:hypothetical protein LSAT2_026514 [Lamellibrachia satsuma]|nr:hypothetical protein LSAT2_026514 [Lamellibrachia satsuma]